jgi:hypothetical protein
MALQQGYIQNAAVSLSVGTPEDHSGPILDELLDLASSAHILSATETL